MHPVRLHLVRLAHG